MTDNSSETVGNTLEDNAGAQANATSVDKDLDREFRKESERWRKESKERPLRILVCGLGGVGKSTLINNLLKLEGDNKLKVGRRGKAVTMATCNREKLVKNGIMVDLWDTPGLRDIELSDQDTIDSVKNNSFDIVFYCVSLVGQSRIVQDDIEAIKGITKALSPEIWKKSVIVLTQANVLAATAENRDNYEEVIGNITKSIQMVLRDEAGIDDQIIIPIVAAGHTDPVLKYKEEILCNDWVISVFLAALSQVDASMFPALLETRFPWESVLRMIGRTVTGVLMGGSAGAGIGAVVGAFGGPIGEAIIIPIATVVGAVIGGTTANLQATDLSIKQITRKQFQMWKRGTSISK